MKIPIEEVLIKERRGGKWMKEEPKENRKLLEIFENKNQSDIAEDLINWRLGYEIKDWGMKIDSKRWKWTKVHQSLYL